MVDQSDATFQEVFSQVTLTEAVKLLTWCISVAVPFHYISRAVISAAQQDEGVTNISKPCPTSSESEPHGSLAPGPSGGLTPPLGTPPLPVSSLPDISLTGTPLVGYPLSNFLVIPSQGKQDHFPSSSLYHHYVNLETFLWYYSIIFKYAIINGYLVLVLKYSSTQVLEYSSTKPKLKYLSC